MAASALFILPAARDAEIDRDAEKLTAAIALVARGIATRVVLVGLAYPDEAVADVGDASADGIGIFLQVRIGGGTAVLVEPLAR